MRRRDFVRGLMALGVTAGLADRLAFVQGLGRVFPSAAAPDPAALLDPFPDAIVYTPDGIVISGDGSAKEWRPAHGRGPVLTFDGGGFRGGGTHVSDDVKSFAFVPRTLTAEETRRLTAGLFRHHRLT